jgi:hypothetical protein
MKLRETLRPLRLCGEGVLALLLIGLSPAQVRKPNLPTSLPSSVPGAGQLPSVPGSPGQAVSDARQAEIAKLMAKALASKDPNEQVKLYTEILLLDPNNTVAYQARKEAQDKIDRAAAEQAQQQAQRAQQVEEAISRETTRRQALKKAEEAYLAGDAEAAARQVEIARRAAPNDPEVKNMADLVGREIESRRRKKYLLLGGGAALAAVLMLVLILRMRSRDPYMEIISGEGKGKRFPFDGEVMRIGAVAQDGASKNDIVVRDVERMISRFHCEIHRRGKKFYLIDCESANGTWVDRKQAPPNKPVRLKGGARIDLAGTATLRLGFEKRKK